METEILEIPFPTKKSVKPKKIVVEPIPAIDDMEDSVKIIDTRVKGIAKDYGGTPPPPFIHVGNGDDRPNGANGNWLTFGLIGIGVVVGGYGYYMHKRGEREWGVLFGALGVFYVVYFGSQLRFPLFGNNIEGDN